MKNKVHSNAPNQNKQRRINKFNTNLLQTEETTWQTLNKLLLQEQHIT